MKHPMKLLAAACTLALAPAVSMANLIPTNTSITGTGPYIWTYNLQLSPDQNVNSGLPPVTNPVPHIDLTFGGFLTLYDFFGFIPGTCVTPAGWTCTAQNVGYTPDDTLPPDNPGIVNITWTYTSGPTIKGDPILATSVDLGNFSLESIYNRTDFVAYSARGVKNNGASAGTIADNVGTTIGPINPALIPEPGSLALLSLGLGFLGYTRRKARKAV